MQKLMLTYSADSLIKNAYMETLRNGVAGHAAKEADAQGLRCSTFYSLFNRVASKVVALALPFGLRSVFHLRGAKVRGVAVNSIPNNIYLLGRRRRRLSVDQLMPHFNYTSLRSGLSVGLGILLVGFVFL